MQVSWNCLSVFGMNPQIKKALYYAVTVVIWVMLAMVIVSWIPPVRDSVVGSILFMVTDPILAPIRAVLPVTGGLDLSPLILFFGLSFVQRRFLT